MVFLEYSVVCVRAFFKKKARPMVHRCNNCPYFTTSLFSIVNHSKRHWTAPIPFNCSKSAPEPYWCKDCNFTTNYTTKFNQHIKTHEVDKPTLKCKECDYQTRNPSEYQQHTHEAPAITFDCKSCPFKGESRVNLKRHFVANHTPLEVVKWFQCDQCPYKCRRKATLEIHSRGHRAKTKVWECRECRYKARNELILQKHLLAHREERENKDVKWLKCDQCKYITKYKSRMRRHTATHKRTRGKKTKWVGCSAYTKKKKPVKKTGSFMRRCRKCPYKTDNQKKLERHSLIHRLKITQRYECENCDYRTNNKSHFLRHKTSFTHIKNAETVLKRFHCDRCDYRTNYKGDLRRHSSRIHKKHAKVREFQCDECDYNTDFNFHLVRHTKICHQKIGECDYKPVKVAKIEIPTLKRETPPKMVLFQCQHCPYEGTNALSLKKHVSRYHNGVFYCPYCPKKTNRKDNMKQHVVKVHGFDMWMPMSVRKMREDEPPVLVKVEQEDKLRDVKWFQCGQCDFTASKKSDLNRHCLHHKRDHACNQCSFKAATEQLLYRHINNVHIEFYCPHCPHTSKRKDRLRRHIDNVHCRGKEWMQCDGCTFRTKTQSFLKEHRERKRH